MRCCYVGFTATALCLSHTNRPRTPPSGASGRATGSLVLRISSGLRAAGFTSADRCECSDSVLVVVVRVLAGWDFCKRQIVGFSLRDLRRLRSKVSARAQGGGGLFPLLSSSYLRSRPLSRPFRNFGSVDWPLCTMLAPERTMPDTFRSAWHSRAHRSTLRGL